MGGISGGWVYAERRRRPADGPLPAAMAGAAFGAGRVVAAVAREVREADPQLTTGLLPRFAAGLLDRP